MNSLASRSYAFELWMRHWQPLVTDQTIAVFKPNEGSPELRLFLRDKEPGISLGDKELMSGQVLNFYKWTHLGFRYHKPTHTATLFLNGWPVAETTDWHDFIHALIAGSGAGRNPSLGTCLLYTSPSPRDA